MKLYVGNLPYNTTDAGLEQLFADFGQVQSATVIKDRDSGRSKGFGFVEIEEADGAQKAIDALNGKEVNGRSLTVNEARPQEDRRPRGDRPFRGGDRGGFRRNY